MEILIQSIAAFFATIFFSIIFNISRDELGYCGLIGALGWLVFSIIQNGAYSSTLANFIAALAVSIFAYFLAIKRKKPVTVFLASGIIPLVPGAGMYKTMFYIITSNPALASKSFIETFQIAGVISLAIAITLSFINNIKIIKKRYPRI